MGRAKPISRRRVLLVLYGAALLLRLLFLWEGRENPFLGALGLDARYYDLRAQEILSEGVIGDEPYFMGPLYPHLLAAVYGTAGRNLVLVRLLQAAIASFLPLLVYRLGVRLFRPSIALVAAVLAVLYGPLIFYVQSLLYTTVAAVLLLWILDRLVVSPVRPGRHHLLTGLLFGLALVGKGNVTLFLPFALLGLAWKGGRQGRWDLRSPLLFLAGVLLVVGLVTARNYASGGELVPLTSNGGLNFYIGNGPGASGAYEKPEGLDEINDPSGRLLLEKALGSPLSYTEVSRIWLRRTLQWIQANPGITARLLLKKTVFFFSNIEIPQIDIHRFEMRYSFLMRLLQIPFGLIAPLGLAATPFLLRRRTFLPLAFLYSYAASIILFFVLTRYRIPVVPVLLILAAFTTVHLLEEGRRREWRSFLRRAAVIVPLFFICNVNFYGISPATGEAQGHYRLGIIFQGEGRLQEAEEEYRASIRLDPDYARSRLNLGELLVVTGRGEEAEKEFREAIAIDPSYTKPHLNLGTILYRSGRLDEGEEEIRRALELDGGYGKAWLHMAALSLLRGARSAGEEARNALVHLDPADPVRPLAGEFLGRIEEVEEMGRWRERRGLPWALPLSTRQAMVAELFRDRTDVEALYREGAAGEDPSALYALGAYYYREERTGEAARVFESARESGVGMPFLSFALGVLRARQGEEEEALRFFLRETEVHPSFAPAWKNAALLSARAGLTGEARRFAAEYVRLGGERDAAIASILE